MPWLTVHGGPEVVRRYEQRAAAVMPGVEWLHNRVMTEADLMYRAFSHGTITEAALKKYYSEYKVGMYGRGTVTNSQADFIINPQPREDGSATWLESFRATGGPKGGGGWRSELHNDAWSTPHGGSRMRLVQAFKRGWRTAHTMMRPRPIAAEVNSGLREFAVPSFGRRVLRSIIAGRPL